MKTQNPIQDINKQTGIRLNVIPVHVSIINGSKRIIQSGFKRGNGFAIRTGSGLCVLDIDCKNGKNGFYSLQEAGIAVDENTVSVLTPSKGKHFYYQYPVDKQLISGSDILSGVDVKADGGLVLCPDTVIQNYGAYTWIHSPDTTEIAPIPEELLAVMQTRQTARATAAPITRQANRTLAQLTAKQRYWLDHYLQAAKTAPQGKRSEKEFALLVWCVKCSLLPDAIWGIVQGIGKFRERGLPYFEFSYKQAQRTK